MGLGDKIIYYSKNKMGLKSIIKNEIEERKTKRKIYNEEKNK